MSKSKYPWDDRFELIFNKAETFDYLRKELKVLFSELQEKGEVSKEIPFSSFYDATLKKAKRRGLLKAQNGNNQEFKELNSQELIEKLESGQMATETFIINLKDDLKIYWGVIISLLKEKRTIRNTQLLSFAGKLKIRNKKRENKLNAIRGILNKFVEWEVLSSHKIDGTRYYFCNLPDFYAPEELYELIPEKNQQLILNALREGSQKVEDLAQNLEKVIGKNLLETLLDYYVSKNILDRTQKGIKLSKVADILGTDPASLEALSFFEAENFLDIKRREEANKIEVKDLKSLNKSLKKDLASKTIQPLDINTKGDSLRLFLFGEVRFGNLFTDLDLLDFAQKEIAKNKPDIVVSSGLVQGDHKSFQVNRLRSLSQSGHLDQIGAQYIYADFLLKDIEKHVKDRNFYIQSDDDFNIAKSRTLIAMKSLLPIRRSGLSALFPEEISRLAGKDYVRYLETQWEYVQSYMYRIGRSLLNENEVNEIVPGLDKNEFLLILIILLFKKFDHAIPESYKKVVDIEALFGDKAKSKRVVTPDPLLLKWDNRLFHFIHNTNYSDVTQYVDSIFVLEKVVRQIQARGEKTADFIIDFHQERFFGTNVHGSFIFNLPGCQNTLLPAGRKFKTFNTEIVGEKRHKQDTFRKEPVTPGIVDLEVFKDGRFKFRVLTNSVRRFLENNKTMPEKKDLFALFQDLQVGSITMRPEWYIKAHDYALYTRKATQVAYNGDIIHGTIYPQHFSENRPKRLVSIKSQQSFVEQTLLPFYPAPAVRKLNTVIGNHEWNNKGTKYEGMDPLSFFETALRNKHIGFKEGGLLEHDVVIMPRSRNRVSNSGNPGGATVHWPFFTEEAGGGYMYAVQHVWQPWGGGRTPVDAQIKWLTNMAGAAKNIDVMFGGDKHSFWVSLVAETLLLQMPGLIDQSGYELARGLTPLSLFCMVEFSNKDGITVEIIPPAFLEEYQCISPFYKDKNDVLVRPKPGSHEYQYGFDSPYIHQIEEEVDSGYLDVL